MNRRADVHVEGQMDPRWPAAIEALGSGHLIGVGNLVMRLEWDGAERPRGDADINVEVDAPPWWHENMNEPALAECRDAIERARQTIELLIASNADFARFGEGRRVNILLVDEGFVKARADSHGDPQWV